MVIVSISYGLGNQMCQYAAARALSIRTNSVLILDNTYFLPNPNYDRIAHQIYGLDFFGIKKPAFKNGHVSYWSKGVIKKLHLNQLFVYYTEEKPLEFVPEVLTTKSKVIYLEGIFQNEKYFVDVADVIRNDFTFKTIDERNILLGKEMRSSISVALHVRRQEFVNKPSYGATPVDYYEKAIQYIKDHVQQPVFYIFSDEMEWVVKNLPVPENSHYITHNTGADSYRDMYLMTQCRHNIIANSSFSWWGAWLNDNPEKIVIAPVGWLPLQGVFTKDLVPDSWIII